MAFHFRVNQSHLLTDLRATNSQISRQQSISAKVKFAETCANQDVFRMMSFNSVLTKICVRNDFYISFLASLTIDLKFAPPPFPQLLLSSTVSTKLEVPTAFLYWDKKAQLSLTNPRDAKACQKLLWLRRAYNVVADNTGLSSFV